MLSGMLQDLIGTLVVVFWSGSVISKSDGALRPQPPQQSHGFTTYA
jgi:hypothetical protein